MTQPKILQRVALAPAAGVSTCTNYVKEIMNSASHTGKSTPFTFDGPTPWITLLLTLFGDIGPGLNLTSEGGHGSSRGTRCISNLHNVLLR